MPLARKEKDELRDIKKEYIRKGYSESRAEYIANSVVYRRKHKMERM